MLNKMFIKMFIKMLGVVPTLFVLACGFSRTQANTPIPKPVCDASKAVSVRYSSTSQRIYLESVDGSRGGCVSLTSVYDALGDAGPLYPLEARGEWMLEESLYVLDGIVLNVHGTDIGGDCDYLKLRSDSDTFVNLRAYGGSLDFVNTKVTSWDPSTSGVDTDWEDGRSYISAISEVLLDSDETCEGVAKHNMGEARMDIENCEISHLGYEASESWGISWKLRGICKDKSNRDKYEGLGVYGNMLGSNVHNLYYGHYGYAQNYALLSGNTVHDNEVYGFDPHDDSVNLTIAHNEVYFNFNHGIIFSKYCHNTIVTNNYVHDNGGVGIFPHYVSDNAIIAHNTVEQNGDSGIAFLESSGGLVYNNTVRDNIHGIRFSVGSRNNVVAGNVFEGNTGYDLYQYAGNDAVVEVETGHPTHNIFFENEFSGNSGGARLDDSVDTQFISNDVSDWSDFEFTDSDNTLILGNTFPADMTFTSSGSCLNSGSDVEMGEPCDSPSITDPFSGAPTTTSDSPTHAPVGSASPTDFLQASTAPTLSISAFYTTGPTETTTTRGGVGNSVSDDDFQTASPTPGQVIPGVPAIGDGDFTSRDDSSGGVSVGIVSGLVAAVTFMAVIACAAI